MIIRTNVARRAAAATKATAPQLSDREKRRLENTKHPEGRISPVIPNMAVETEPVEEVKVRVEEEKVETVKTVEEIKPAVVEKTIDELDNTVVEPGTAMIRSKVLEELDKQAEKPKKKYKIISMGNK